MGILSDMIVPANFILTTALTSILVFDRHDEEQRKYIKAIWFLLGGAGIILFYKFSKLGELVDETLESEIFDNVFVHKLT
tara:strand:+ start:592 stop:831 length:240 start_codon:yes stop_codon:yes gene_type:complete